MPDVISNSSPLQYLYQVEVLNLLPSLFRQILVPEAVVAELQAGRRRNVPLPSLEELSWLQVRTVRDRRLLPAVTRLGEGEKEVLALGLEMPDALLLLDDEDARGTETGLAGKSEGRCLMCRSVVPKTSLSWTLRSTTAWLGSVDHHANLANHLSES